MAPAVGAHVDAVGGSGGDRDSCEMAPTVGAHVDASSPPRMRGVAPHASTETASPEQMAALETRIRWSLETMPPRRLR